MDEFIDDDFLDESWKESKKKSKKIKNNPAGPYTVDLVFKGVNWHIVIKNKTMDEFNVAASADKKVSFEELEVLRKYLKDEGFEMAARKHNLFWY
jgi:hypothetical protein